MVFRKVKLGIEMYSAELQNTERELIPNAIRKVASRETKFRPKILSLPAQC